VYRNAETPLSSHASIAADVTKTGDKDGAGEMKAAGRGEQLSSVLSKYVSSLLVICRYIYEGCSVNKLYNNVILLIFLMCKFGNIRFVGNLLGDIHCSFHDDDFLIVASPVLRTQTVSAVFCQLFSLTTCRR